MKNKTTEKNKVKAFRQTVNEGKVQKLSIQDLKEVTGGIARQPE